MTSAEIPDGLVEIRTIDDSPSHEGDIVIVDLARTSKPGFITVTERMAVMATQTKMINMFINKVKVFEHSPRIGSLVENMINRNDIVCRSR
ncbi:uncharacterized protein AUP68_03277 [Ilyonectria robusta]